ncbi:MAG: hypothetical protein SGILL_006393 [Bacillariaceae sp.]
MMSKTLSPTQEEEQQEEEAFSRQEENTPQLPLPLISIELKKLIGYAPSSQDVVDSIQSQLVEAMWSRYRQENGDGEIDIVAESEEKLEGSSKGSPVLLPPDFDSQMQELLEARIARFGRPPTSSTTALEGGETSCPADNQAVADNTATPDSSATQQPQHFEHLVLSYPPKIRNPLATMGSSNSLLDAAKAWNEIHQLGNVLPLSPLPPPQEDQGDRYPRETSSPSTDFIQKLTTHLVNTSRTLTWKYAMAKELQQIIKNELLWKQHEEWCTVQRQAKLDNLYQVRETLVHQKELAQDDWEHLANARDQKVAQELVVEYQRQRLLEEKESDGAAGVDSTDDLDLTQELRAMGLMPRQNGSDVENDNNQEDMWEEESLGAGSYSSYGSSSSSSSSNEDDDEEDSIDNDQVGGEIKTLKGGIPTEIKIGEDAVNADDSSKNEENQQNDTEEEGMYRIMEEERPPLTLPFQRRKERRKRAKEQKRKEKREAELETKREKLRAIKERLEQQHTSRELILSQTMLNSLQKKVENVDELLESLQDEVWAAEEEDEEEAIKTGLGSSNRTEKPSLSLLDQVLAMILGALPPTDPNKTPKEQYAFAKSEHSAIVEGWESYFGRLPPAVNADSSVKDDGPEAITEPAGKTSQAPKPTPQEQRDALGIVDNDDADWDVDD